MNSWIKTGKGMMSSLMDVVAPIGVPLPLTNRKNKNNQNNVLFTSINQDCSYVCCGTSDGFSIYRSKPFEKVFESTDVIALKMEMLFDKSLIAILTTTPSSSSSSTSDDNISNINTSTTTNTKNNRNIYYLKLFNISTSSTICCIGPINKKLSILNFKINKSRLVISSKANCLTIYDITSSLKKLNYDIITYDDNGIFDLCNDNNNNLLAYPDQSFCGRIGIINAYNLNKKIVIQAHDTNIQILKFNKNGSWIASASKTGTLIRIFDVNNDGNILYTLRRGTTKTKIECLSFNKLSTLLCCSSSNSDRIHVWYLNTSSVNQYKTQLPSINVVKDYLPISVKHTIEYPRSSVQIQIKTKINNINSNNSYLMKCGFINDYCIVISTQNGYFYRYSVNINSNNVNSTSSNSMFSYKLLSEHSLKSKNNDLQHQCTTIYKSNNNNNNDMDNYINNNDNVNQQQLSQSIVHNNVVNNNQITNTMDDNKIDNSNQNDNDIDLNIDIDKNELLINGSPESQSPDIFDDDNNSSNILNDDDKFTLNDNQDDT